MPSIIHQNKNTKVKAFALLAVSAMVIIGVVLIPGCSFSRESNSRTRLHSHMYMKHLNEALLNYAHTHGNRIPDMTNIEVLKKLLQPYLNQHYPYYKGQTLFYHAVTGKPYHQNISLSRQKLSSFQHPAQVITFYESEPDEDNDRLAVYLDGQNGAMEEADWNRLKASLNGV